MEHYFEKASEDHIRRERARAREMRQSQWWKNRIGAGLCYYCGKRFAKTDLTMDHRIPVVRGGRSTKSNVVVSCKPCNSDKKYWTRAELEMQRTSGGTE